MASFSLGISAAEIYKGSGSNLPLGFRQYYPPDVGCIGYSSPGDTLEIKASITNLARRYIARSIVDGTSFKITEFAVGIGGYDPSFPLNAVNIDNDATELEAEVFRKLIDRVESPLSAGNARAFLCRLNRDDVRAGIGEIALFAEILSSPYASELGQKFMFCAVHQPLNAKTSLHVNSFRVIVVV